MSVTDLLEFDVTTGGFTADLYLTSRCTSACDPHFDFRNGAVVSTQERRGTDNYKEYRVRVGLQEPTAGGFIALAL